MMSPRGHLLAFLVAVVFAAVCDGRQVPEAIAAKHNGAPPEFPRPDHTEYAKMVRWLVHLNTWGSLATLNKDNNKPSGGVVSFSDGAWDNSTGRIIMYLTPLDYTAQNLKADPSAALVVAESQLMPSGCDDVDPENPTCAKVEAVGKVTPVPADQLDTVKEIMFSRHPEMADWPQGHHFQFFELQPDSFHLLDYFGGVHTIDAEEYFAVELTPAAVTSQ